MKCNVVESHLDMAYNVKMDSHSHFITDIKTFAVSVTPFEVGANTGHLDNDTKKKMHNLHIFCKKRHQVEAG